MPLYYKPGLRKSQAITTFGPGSIVDLRYTSVMIAGLDFWRENQTNEIHHPELEKLIKGIKLFRMPKTEDENGGKSLPAVIFPEWLVCSCCDRLAPFEFFTQGTQQQGKQIKCPDCNKRVYPARLVVACKQGHIDDFPWAEWVHEKAGMPVCDKPALFLRSRGFSSTLADLELSCKECNIKTSMGGATQESNLNFHQCTGLRPWLEDNEECNEKVRPLQRGASNVYFPILVSAISIPPWSSGLFSVLDPYWEAVKHIDDNIALKKIVEGMNLPDRTGYAIEEIVQAIISRQQRESGDKSEISEKEIRYQECLSLRNPPSIYDTGSEFVASPTNIHPDIHAFISKVVLVQRLREVRALRGFTRIDAPDPSSRLKSSQVPISRDRKNWLPAVEVRGEGVYVELNEDKILKWSSTYSVKTRAAKLQNTYLEMCERRNWLPERNISPRLLQVHSLAHILIRQLSLESGYSSAALRERIYVFEPGEMNGNAGIAGFLIYTSTPDSEGSLGGLVRQGEEDRLSRTIRNAIRDAAWCSSDPLCIESEGQGHDATNLAACHACLLISETSCEEYNRFLDRALLTGTLDNPATGFFEELARN